MKITYSLILASLCSISSLFAMQMKDLPDDLQQIIKATMAADTIKTIFKNKDFINKYTQDFPTMTLEELEGHEKTYKGYLETMNGLPYNDQNEEFKETVQNTQNLLHTIQQAKYAKMPFIQRNAKLLTFGGVAIGLAIVSYIAYKIFNKAPKTNQPLKIKIT